MRFASCAVVLMLFLLACSGESLIYSDAKPSKPSGVTEYGWENWNLMSEAEQGSVCAALQSMATLETQSMTLAAESGAALPTRPPESADARDLRILCNVPAPDHRALQSAAAEKNAPVAGKRAQVDNTKPHPLYGNMTPASRIRVCTGFRDQGDGRVSFNPDSINEVIITEGFDPLTTREQFGHLEETCRYYVSERAPEEVRYIIDRHLTVEGSQRYICDRYKPGAPISKIRRHASPSLSDAAIELGWRAYCGG